MVCEAPWSSSNFVHGTCFFAVIVAEAFGNGGTDLPAFFSFMGFWPEVSVASVFGYTLVCLHMEYFFLMTMEKFLLP
jgi:hypothetical protein